MHNPHPLPAARAANPWPHGSLRLPRGFPWALATVLLLFSPVLRDLALLSARDGRYSHILLLPFISIYLIWVRRSRLREWTAPDRVAAVAIAGAGVALLIAYVVSRVAGTPWRSEDALALTTTAFVTIVLATCWWYFGGPARRVLVFPVTFLFFLVPLPHGLMTAIETFMQYGSAACAHAFFRLAGTTVFYERLNFQLPGISLHVAPECSGIRSTLVLFIVSVISGHLFLRSALSRVGLSALVVPLALLRNGFRIFIIGELCSHIGPEMIDSYLHRQGGPIFFGLSLIPFFIVLTFLMKRDRWVASAPDASIGRHPLGADGVVPR